MYLLGHPGQDANTPHSWTACTNFYHIILLYDAKHPQGQACSPKVQ